MQIPSTSRLRFQLMSDKDAALLYDVDQDELAGGCETGWMYRAVEGQVHYWWVGLGNVIGSTLLVS